MKITNLKPIEYDIHFKYLCPNPSCCYPHWLSLKEASLLGYKSICDCGTVFSVKQIEKIKIKYIDDLVSKSRNVFDKKQYEPIEIDETIFDEPAEPTESTVTKAKNLLIHYGFSESEAESMIDNALKDNPQIDDYLLLVKNSIFLVKND